jgi:serine protease Do
MKSGDIIVSVNGKKMDEVRDLTGRVAALPPGSEAEIEVIRDGKSKTLTVVLGEREEGEALATGEGTGADESGMGLTVTELSPALARKLGVDEDLKGVVVKEVEPASPAAGIVREGDIILEVNRKRITDAEDFRRAISGPGDDKSVLFRIQRGSAQIYVVVSK